MNSHGIGLGLFVCKRIVTEFDGEIVVNSKKDVGSCFTFSFLLSKGTVIENDYLTQAKSLTQLIPKQHMTVYTSDSSSSADDFRQRILLVDDEPFNIMAIEGMMKVVGFNDYEKYVDRCYNGEQSVAMFKKAVDEGEPNRYPLIITDCNMPFMDGY